MQSNDFDALLRKYVKSGRWVICKKGVCTVGAIIMLRLGGGFEPVVPFPGSHKKIHDWVQKRAGIRTQSSIPAWTFVLAHQPESVQKRSFFFILCCVQNFITGDTGPKGDFNVEYLPG